MHAARWCEMIKMLLAVWSNFFSFYIHPIPLHNQHARAVKRFSISACDSSIFDFDWKRRKRLLILCVWWMTESRAHSISRQWNLLFFEMQTASAVVAQLSVRAKKMGVNIHVPWRRREKWKYFAIDGSVCSQELFRILSVRCTDAESCQFVRIECWLS